MLFRTLTNKRAVLDINNQFEFDLSDKTYDNSIKARIIDTYEVTAFSAMRWDYISSKYYGTTNLADALFKFNEYPNPFSLAEGDIVIIPHKEDLERNIVRDTSINDLSANTQIQFTLRKKVLDKNRQAFTQKKQQFVPPSFAKTNVRKANNDGTLTIAK